MFQDLSDRLEGVFRKLRGRGKLTEKDVNDALREIRRALLEADVNYKVAKQFVDRVREKAVGQEVLKSVTPAQQVVKIVHDELTALMGGRESGLRFGNIPPTGIMLVGLQGSGKTTLAGKLARYLQKKGHRPLLVAADVRRPAAVKQLQVVGEAVGVPVFAKEGADAVTVCVEAVAAARQGGRDVAIFDTAGRLHVDQELMQELAEIRDRVKPQEVLLVADAMTGQDAVNVAQEFLRHLDYDGIVLTKLDGDARGGAALSMRAVTGKPIKFVGVGEKFDALEKFHPDRMASRILGMGDVVTLVERAQQAVDEEKARKLEKRLRHSEFTLEDFLEQLQQIKKMGPLEEILGMIPGMSSRKMRGLQVDDRALVRIEAIINSMTREERRRPQIIDGSRRRRIARGSGTSVQDVNRLLRDFESMRKMMRRFGRGKGLPGLPF